LGTLLKKVQEVIRATKLPPNTRVELRGSVVAMKDSFKSFAIGLTLSIVLVYLILMAQFASFSDPSLILLAVPPGFTRRRGQGLEAAIKNACHVRLRPIMMTTFATFLGLIPLALAPEAGSE